MHAKSLRVKLIGIFLVAFVCLNAGGAVCVAYCRTVVEAVAASSDHCPLKKKASHCDPAKKGETASAEDSVGADRIDFCTMTVSFIGAPIEKRTFSLEISAAAVPTWSTADFPISFQAARQNPPPAYRGPPLDRRIERIKHRLIRI